MQTLTHSEFKSDYHGWYGRLDEIAEGKIFIAEGNKFASQEIQQAAAKICVEALNACDDFLRALEINQKFFDKITLVKDPPLVLPPKPTSQPEVVPPAEDETPFE